MVKRFNINKPHGTVHGDGFTGFEQNGVVYNAAYQPIDFNTRKLLPIDDEPAANPKPAAQASDGGDGDEEGDAPQGSAVDLDKWLSGDGKYAWVDIQNAVAKINNGVKPKTKDEAKAIALDLNDDDDAK